MTDAEISSRLALAIGWRCTQIKNCDTYTLVRVPLDWAIGYRWRQFDYRDPAVIWPIAEHFNAFPVIVNEKWWVAYFGNTVIYSESGTAAKAVALAVIKAHEAKK